MINIAKPIAFKMFQSKYIYNFYRLTPSIKYSSTSVTSKNNLVFSTLKPHLDFDERLADIETLERSIKLRGLDINLNSLVTLWKHFKTIKKDVDTLEKERIRIFQEITDTDANVDPEKLKSLKFLAVNARENLKKTKQLVNELEEKIYPCLLQLPNDVIDKKEKVLYENMMPDYQVRAQNHLDVGTRLNLIEFHSPSLYFLKDSAALFELNVTSALSKLFNNNGFLRFSNPDFTRSSIVKYLQLDDVQSLLSLEKQRDQDDEDRFHLHGGASILPFCCFLHRSLYNLPHLPLRYVTKGRHYEPSELPGLYGVWQNNSVQFFIGTNQEEIDNCLTNVLEITKSFYSMFQVPIRIIHSEPVDLSLSEKLRISIQTYSAVNKQFIELGNISLYGNYISKRLRIYYADTKSTEFMHVISGTVLKVAPLIAALLESNDDCKILNALNKKYDKLS